MLTDDERAAVERMKAALDVADEMVGPDECYYIADECFKPDLRSLLAVVERCASAEETVEWGLWDEGRERWVRKGYKTPGEAGVARTEIERHFREGDDTNLQIFCVNEEHTQ